MPTARVYCEESQRITIELRAMGIEAFSIDRQPCSGGHPEWHMQCDMRDVMHEYCDLSIFHPTCRFIANSGVQWLEVDPHRHVELRIACDFFNLRHSINSPLVATENPIPHGYAVRGYVESKMGRKVIHSVNHIGSYDQLFQPWHHGEKKMKATCLWLKGLPPLIPSNIVGPPPKDKAERRKWQDVWMASPGPDRERLRSVTYPGVARAIAQQYGKLII